MTKQRTTQRPEQPVADILEKEQRIVEITGKIKAVLDGTKR